MKVLVACEYSGRVRDAFLRRGHDALSCDILPTESPGPHYQGDVRDILSDGWDLMIAHPPCTHLAVSGAAWFANKQDVQPAALEFVRLLLGAHIPRIAVENPISIISTRIRKPDQIIQPWQFGHDTSKSTCLWLKGLPRLTPTDIVQPVVLNYKGGTKRASKWFIETSNLPKPYQAHVRSLTFEGIAEAMAEQWGNAAVYCFG